MATASLPRQVLTGHTSPETAYLVEDYPYGFRLRCKKRYWLEFKKGHGFRMVTQTTNPKRHGQPIGTDSNGDYWNKSKAGTYSLLSIMFLDEQGHVQHDGIGLYSNAEEVEQFERIFGAGIAGEPQQSALRLIKASVRASKRMKWGIVKPGDPPSPCRQCGGQREHVTNPQGPQDVFTAVDHTAFCSACDEVGPAHQTMQEQAAIVNGLIRDELKRG